MVKRPSQRSRSSWEALLKVWEWLGSTSLGPGVVGRPFWRCVSGREADPVVREWSGGHPAGLGVF